jgi:hypothetical protein
MGVIGFEPTILGLKAQRFVWLSYTPLTATGGIEPPAIGSTARRFAPKLRSQYTRPWRDLNSRSSAYKATALDHLATRP